MLPSTWPSAVDIEYIVKKSSGQFIYAATVMRFRLDSSASPKLSLERVKGAARLATKSPFSHLDAISTYILTQVDDQQAVKDILHAQLLIGRLLPFRQIPLIKVLSLYNPAYTEDVVLSCLADLTPLADSGCGHTVLFHHASFPDYLLDESRSTDYYVDIAAFSYKILPMVWEISQKSAVEDLCTYSAFIVCPLWFLTSYISLGAVRSFRFT